MRNGKYVSDEKLVKQVINKDQELYSEIVKRYQDKLIRFAVKILGDKHKADDVVQEAFIKAFVNLRGFNTKKKFSSWIYRIVHNEAINLIRKYKKETSLDKNLWLKETVKDKTDIENNFTKEETAKMLNSCLNSLPAKYRSPLVLFFFEEKSYEEISDVLRIPTSTVGTRISRGKKMIRTVCESEK